MHVGTFTPEGTWAAAARELPALADLGVTVLEVMPVADFPGRFGWGYDGVDLFAPTRLYGTPDDLRALRRSRARARPRRDPRRRLQPPRPRRQLPGGVLAGLLHRPLHERLGRGDQLRRRRAGAVREFFVENAGYWIDEFHLDGLRLDATQDIFDASPEHILAGDRRARARGGRRHARSSSSPRTSRRTRGSCATRRRRAASGSTRSGTTTFTTRARGRADRAQRGLLHRLPRHRRRSSSRRASTASSTRGSGTRGRRSGAARRRSISRRTRSSPTSRITTRSPTRRAGDGCTS